MTLMELFTGNRHYFFDNWWMIWYSHVMWINSSKFPRKKRNILIPLFSLNHQLTAKLQGLMFIVKWVQDLHLHYPLHLIFLVIKLEISCRLLHMWSNKWPIQGIIWFRAYVIIWHFKCCCHMCACRLITGPVQALKRNWRLKQGVRLLHNVLVQNCSAMSDSAY